MTVVFEECAVMVQPASNPSHIVSSAPVAQRAGISSIDTIRTPLSPKWAPAWFYSALNWLGKSYVDANGAEQAFNN
jgi:hypothetical protein